MKKLGTLFLTGLTALGVVSCDNGGGGNPASSGGSARENANFFTADGNTLFQTTDCGGNELVVNVRPSYATVNYTVSCNGVEYSYDGITGPLDNKHDQLHIGIGEGCRVTKAGVMDAMQSPTPFDRNSCIVKEGVYDLLQCVRGAGENTDDIPVLNDGETPYGRLPDSVCEKPVQAPATMTSKACGDAGHSTLISGTTKRCDIDNDFIYQYFGQFLKN